jgi:3',5'-cyclic AMP phosphodiesterase CpdA
MTDIRPIENLYAALWKSVAAEVVAKQQASDGQPAGVASDHPLMAATDLYVDALSNGQAVAPPSDASVLSDEEDPEIGAYLAQLHHRLAHAQVNQDYELQKELQRQLEEFRFGNPLWEQMLIQYFEYYWQYPYHKGGQPLYRSWKTDDAGCGNPNYSVIEWRLPADARIAVVGDIGTGTDVAAAVLNAALSFRPDAILHVGDVYYSGTSFEFAERFVGLFDSVFESAGFRVPVFIVPGNHEYFTGGVAFYDCLSSGKFAVSADQKQAASYFCLRSADDGWQFLGLDTGFYGHTMAVTPKAEADALRILHDKNPNIPLDPPVAPPASGDDSAADLPIEPPTEVTGMVAVRDDEAEWHSHQIENFSGRSILLSHHQLYSAAQTCGVAQRTIKGTDGQTAPDPTDFNRRGVDTKLWQQFGAHFGVRVAAWLWGHEHNLCIFQDNYRPADWPEGTDEAANVYRALPKGRCVGHSAIPVADKENPYAVNNPVPLKDDSLRLGLTDGWYNHGFEIIDLAGAHNPARIRYYQLAGIDTEPSLIHEESVE